jgi:NAD-dependent SIR2 family protein deacetylase
MIYKRLRWNCPSGCGEFVIDNDTELIFKIMKTGEFPKCHQCGKVFRAGNSVPSFESFSY